MAEDLSDANHLLALTSSEFGADVLLVNSFSGSEGLSRMFRFDLNVMAEISKAGQITADNLIGKSVTLTLKLPNEESRYFNGIINQFVDVDQYGDIRYYQLQVVPWLWILTLNSDCRIFQGMTVPDILKQIFAPYGPIRNNLQSTYTKWDYRVQYRETHYNFVSRLMEQEGIFYFFDHEDGKHTLVLSDSAPTLTYGTLQKQVSFAPNTQLDDQSEGVIFSWHRSQQLDPGMSSTRDYHFMLPDKKLEGIEVGLYSVGGNGAYEVYDYPGGYAAKFNQDDPDRLRALDSQEPGQIARLRMEEEETPHDTYTGESLCGGLLVGYRFDLQDHPTMDGAYLVKTVQHSGSQSHKSGEKMMSPYSNKITCIPSGRVFRPNRISLRPVVQGPHSALVVGKPGDEICTDEFGRIKVQFPWDRLGKKNDQSSCWLRVAQFWAGAQWGAIFTPRVGHEVLVDYIEGDPDQPIVIGSLYNKNNMPPYTLPDNQTQSGIKTRSSKGGGSANFNEIRFEDKKGSEDLLIHAEKTMHNSVETTQTITTGVDRDITVGGMDEYGNKIGTVHEKIFLDSNLHVLNEQRIKIEGGRSLHVMKNQNELVDESKSVHVKQQLATKIEDDETHHVMGNRMIQVDNNMSTWVQGGGVYEYGKDLSLTATHACLITAPRIIIQGTTEIVLVAGSSSITIDSSGVTIVGSPLINLNSPGASPSAITPPKVHTGPDPSDPIDPIDPP